MSALPRISFGAPGIYKYPETSISTLSRERMDVCAFVGIAPRGPSREPEIPENWTGEYALVGKTKTQCRSIAIVVESMDEYISNFGNFDGPGRLPYAVASFFEQGGKKAYIVRIVHQYENAEDDKNYEAVAKATLLNASISTGNFTLVARNEGSWGNQLRAVLGYALRSILLLADSSTLELRVSINEDISIGDLLRLTLVATETESTSRHFRYVSNIRNKGLNDSNETILLVTLNAGLDRVPYLAEVVTGELLIRDGQGQLEHFSELGLSSQHHRWIATVLFNESQLVYPEESWIDADIKPLDQDFIPLAPVFGSTDTVSFSNGKDRYSDITFDDFFDNHWTFGDSRSGAGIQALINLPDLSSLVIPDLYVPGPILQSTEDSISESLLSAEFQPCVDIEMEYVKAEIDIPELKALYLDPQLPDDLDMIIQLQNKAADFVDKMKSFILLLDVPPGINQNQILYWRANFRTSYAAAYYPWLKMTDFDGTKNNLILINPSAVAAGIIAHQEIKFGVPHGPANIIAENVVKVDEIISPAQHDLLHPNGINIYLQQRDGAWLSAARTLSRDTRYRQLSVRRLMTMIKRTLQKQMQWAVFEPNGPALWANIRYMLTNFLRGLYAQGAFRGATESEAFFVRCDALINTQREIDAGKMVAEIGVAPAEPLEFIFLNLIRGGDGTLTIEG